MSPAQRPSVERLQELVDRQDILDCILRVARGDDRLDDDLIRSAYHPEAVDDHGVFKGSRDEFIEWLRPMHLAAHRGHNHYIMNHVCEIDGDTAHTETYMIMRGSNTTGSPLTLHGARYIDQFERRDGEWRILHRVSMIEWTGALTEQTPSAREPNGVVARDRSDTSYARPLLSPERMPAVTGDAKQGVQVTDADANR